MRSNYHQNCAGIWLWSNEYTKHEKILVTAISIGEAYQINKKIYMIHTKHSDLLTVNGCVNTQANMYINSTTI